MLVPALLCGLAAWIRPRWLGGLPAHPLVVGPLVGLALGDLYIGVTCGAGLALLFEREADSSLEGAVGAAAATGIGIWLAEASGMGGLLMESFTGIVLGAVVGGLVRPLRSRIPWEPVLACLLVAAAVLGLGPLGARLWIHQPDAVRLTSPWLSGLVMAVGMGAALGARWRRGPDGQITVGSQAAAGRLFTAVGALLAMDLLGMWGLPALLAAGLVSHVATRRYDVTPPLGRRLAMQEVVLATVTLVAAVRVVWLPWAFESDPVPLFPGRIEAAIEVGWLGQVAAVPLLLGIGVEGTRRGWRLPVVLAVGLVALVLLMLTGL